MLELQLLCPQAQVERLCEALEELGAASVSVEDADAHTEVEQALFGEPGMPVPAAAWNRSSLSALFQEIGQAQTAAALMQSSAWAGQCVFVGLQELAEQDWVRLTQSQFNPVAVTNDFWIVPSWHEVPAAAVRSIRLDPGLAFGTGTHPTTRMCLRWIAQHRDRHFARVLDYGCGSGVLAMAAVLHGALSVDAVDIDPAAVQSTVLNAQANQLALNSGLPELARGRYDLVLANILATPLRLLAPVLCGHVAPGGCLVLSGILERQADELTQAYAPFATLGVVDREDGWIVMSADIPSLPNL